MNSIVFIIRGMMNIVLRPFGKRLQVFRRAKWSDSSILYEWDLLWREEQGFRGGLVFDIVER